MDEDYLSEDRNYYKIVNLDEEIKYINYLIKIMEQRLSEYNTDHKTFNNGIKLNLSYEDLCGLKSINNIQDNSGVIIAKSEGGVNIDINKTKENNNVICPKKKDININKIIHWDDNHYPCGYSNILAISSKNKRPINLEKIDLKNIKSKEREKEKEKDELLTNFKVNNENENIINNMDIINNENGDNKSEIISNQLKSFHFDNKIRKDSIISDFSYHGNAPNNIFLDATVFNNMNYNIL